MEAPVEFESGTSKLAIPVTYVSAYGAAPLLAPQRFRRIDAQTSQFPRASHRRTHGGPSAGRHEIVS